MESKNNDLEIGYPGTTVDSHDEMKSCDSGSNSTDVPLYIHVDDAYGPGEVRDDDIEMGYNSNKPKPISESDKDGYSSAQLMSNAFQSMNSYYVTNKTDKDQIIVKRTDEEEEVNKMFSNGKGWGELKSDLFDLINTELKDSREKYFYFLNNANEVEAILKKGEIQASLLAEKKLIDVRNKIGIKPLDEK